MTKHVNKYAEMLYELSLLDQQTGVAMKDSSILNSKEYAKEQIQNGTANGKTAEELEISWLERHVQRQKNQSGQSST